MAKSNDSQLSHYLKEEVAVCVSYRDGKILVTPDPVEIWSTKKERAHWFACGDTIIESLAFSASPFSGPVDFHPTKKHALSGAVLNSIPPNSKPFKYTVTVRYQGTLLSPFDPEVHVMP